MAEEKGDEEKKGGGEAEREDSRSGAHVSACRIIQISVLYEYT